MIKGDPSEPIYRFSNGKLHVVTGTSLVIFDGHQAKVETLTAGKTMGWILGIFGFIPLIVFMNAIAEQVAHNDATWIMTGAFAAFWMYAVGSMAFKGTQAISARMANVPANLNDPQYISHLKMIYHRELNKQQPIQAFAGNLTSWLLMAVLAVGALVAFVFSCYHLVSAIGTAQNAQVSKGDKNLPAEVREQQIEARLADPKAADSGIEARVALESRLADAQSERHEYGKALLTYDKILVGRIMLLAQARTSAKYESQLQKIASDAVYRTEVACADLRDPQLASLEKRILDAVAQTAQSRKADVFESERFLVRKVAKTCKKRGCADLTSQTNDVIAGLTNSTPEQKHQALADQFHKLLLSVVQQYPPPKNSTDAPADNPTPSSDSATPQPLAHVRGAGPATDSAPKAPIPSPRDAH